VNLAADGNSNDVIDTGDLTFWKQRLGQAGGAGGKAAFEFGAAPEPTGFVMLAIGVIMSATLRRR